MKTDIPYDRFVPWDGSCPHCSGYGWYEGPRDGTCVNLQCSSCLSWLNVTDHPLLPRQAQRIDKKPITMVQVETAEQAFDVLRGLSRKDKQ